MCKCAFGVAARINSDLFEPPWSGYTVAMQSLRIVEGSERRQTQSDGTVRFVSAKREGLCARSARHAALSANAISWGSVWDSDFMGGMA
eukprot:6212559-Pleurochrysis_carterae.AAC.5